MRKYLERRVLGVLESTMRSGSEEEQQAALLKAQRDLPVWERQATIYKLYQRPHKTIMVRFALADLSSLRGVELPLAGGCTLHMLLPL
jgi:hypothetical protein